MFSLSGWHLNFRVVAFFNWKIDREKVVNHIYVKANHDMAARVHRLLARSLRGRFAFTCRMNYAKGENALNYEILKISFPKPHLRHVNSRKFEIDSCNKSRIYKAN